MVGLWGWGKGGVAEQKCKTDGKFNEYSNNLRVNIFTG